MISVVIPVRDGAPTLSDQLQALANQAGPATGRADWEVVVADNGSRDRTRDVAAAFATRLPLRVVDASERRGPAATRNAGARASAGDFLVFTDADDVVRPTWLDAWHEAAEHVAFATGPLTRLTPSAPPTHGADGSDDADAPGGGRFRLPRHLGFLPYAFGTNFGVRRVLFDAMGGFDEGYRTAEDVELSWRIQLSGVDLTLVPRAVVAVRRRERARDIVRTYFAYGRSDPALYRSFRTRGLARPSARATARSYAGLIARAPLLFRRETREAWCAQLGRRAGRIVGSVEHHVFVP